MGIMALAIKSKTLRRCDYCHNATHNIYRVKLGEMVYQFCSGAHANMAANNFAERQKQGITPSITQPEVEESYE